MGQEKHDFVCCRRQSWISISILGSYFQRFTFTANWNSDLSKLLALPLDGVVDSKLADLGCLVFLWKISNPLVIIQVCLIIQMHGGGGGGGGWCLLQHWLYLQQQKNLQVQWNIFLSRCHNRLPLSWSQHLLWSQSDAWGWYRSLGQFGACHPGVWDGVGCGAG